MSYAIAAETQVVLEGVPLPAAKERLVDYAQHQHAEPRVLAALRAIPDRVYRAIDEVGEELARVQPSPQKSQPHEPHEESGRPPGNEDYTRVPTDTGDVREASDL
jgi:hypothetical protein